MDERTYRGEGMTCGHCAAAVREEVGGVDGVASVDVDLEGGTVTVRGDGVADDRVSAAVEEAGYRVVAAPR